MRILVTGANGFLGAHVSRALCAAGHDVRAMVQPGTPTASLDGLALERLPGDVTNPEDVHAAVQGAHAVVHLAAIARDWGPPELFERVNAGGTARLVDAATEAGVQRFVLMSSVAVHAYTQRIDADEDTPRDGGTFPYAETKIAAEDRVTAAHAAGRLQGVIVRPGLVPYGPGDVNALVPLAGALEKHVMPLVGNGRTRISLSYAENLADGVVLAATRPEAAGETFLLADPEVVTWREYFDALAGELGVRALPLPIPAAVVRPLAAAMEAIASRLPGQPEPPLTNYRARLLTHDLVFRSDRAERLLGWKPKVSFEEGIRRTVAWYRAARR